MPLIIAAGALGLLGIKLFSDEAEDVVNSTAPNLAVLAALGIAGFAIWQLSKRVK